MKILIGTLLLAASVTAQAQTWQMNNQSNGKIVLTTRDCPEYPNKGLRSGYAYGQGGKTLSFCWAIVDGMIKALYRNGDEYTYNPNAFTKVE